MHKSTNILQRTKIQAVTGRNSGASLKLAPYVSNAVQDCSKEQTPEETDKYENAKYSRNRLNTLRKDIGQFVKRVRPCGSWRTDKEENVNVARSASGSVFYSGLQTCKSVWSCPVCSLKIQAARTAELRNMLMNAIDNQGKKGLFVTLTLPHFRNEELKDLQTTVSACWRILTADIRYKGQYRKKKGVSFLASTGLKQEYGIEGFVRALEVKYGRYGWHPHLHISFICSEDLTQEDLNELGRKIVALWGKLIDSESGKTINDEGQSYSPIYDAKGVADYSTKWDLAQEMVSAHRKEKSGSYTPFQLFEEFQADGEEEYLNLFLTYNEAFKRVKQLTYSKDFKKKFLTITEKTDAEACADEQQETILCSLHPYLFNHLRANGHESDFTTYLQFGRGPAVLFLVDLYKEALSVAYDHETGIQVFSLATAVRGRYEPGMAWKKA